MSSRPAVAATGTQGGAPDLDLRLVPAAVTAWVVAWQVRVLPPSWVVLAATVLALAGAAVLRRGRRGWAAGLAAALLCASAAGLATTARTAGRTTGPLPALAARQAAVVVTARLTEDPRLAAGQAGRDLVVVRLRVDVLTAGGRSYALRAPVLLLSQDRAWLPLLPGQRVRAEGRLGPAERGDDVAAVLSGRGPPSVLGRPGVVQRVAGRLRAGLRDAVAVLPEAERGLLPGLVVGDTSRLDEDLREDFRTTGLTHLTAVSGTNCAVVAGAALLLTRRLGVGVRGGSASAGLALLLFVVLARPSPSVLRAAVMGAVGLAALAAGSRRQAVPALAAAVLLLVLLDPDLAATPGFALSVLATGGLLLVAPTWRERLGRRVPQWLADALAVPAAAQLVCGPVVVALSGQLGLLSVPANLLAAVAVAPATVLGVLVALVAPISLPLAQGLAWLAYLPTAWLVLVARTGAGVPGATVGWPDGHRGAVLLVLATAVLCVVLSVRWPRRALAAGGVGVLLAVVGLAAVRPSWPPPGWFLVECDVGQGDAQVLSLGQGAALVVDAGPDPRAVNGCLRRLGVDRVPLVLLTHLHADHVEGLPGVLDGRSVGEVQVGPLDEPPEEWRRVLRWTAARGVPVVPAGVGEVRHGGALSWEVLGPTRAFHGTTSDPNNSSVVLRVRAGGISVLLTGDVEPEAQRDLLRRKVDLRADVLKVPHHGSQHQEPAFLRAVGARVALVGVGADNTYGHPSPQTLDLVMANGARAYRTDQDGDTALVLREGRLLTAGREGSGHTTGPVAGPAPADGLPAVALPAAPPLPAPPTRAVSSATHGSGAQSTEPAPAAVRPRARDPPYVRADRAAWHDRCVPDQLLVPLTLVVGDEGLLVDRAVSAVLRAARAADPEVDVRDMDAAQLEPGALDAVLAPSLFGERRVLVLRGVQEVGKDIAAEITAYAADPLEEVSLVLVHAGGAKGKALLTALAARKPRTVDAAKITKASERRDLVRRELKADGRKVDEDAVTALLDAVGSDLRELCSAAGQLLSDTEGPITEEAVSTYYRGRAEASGFAVAERAVDGDLAGALELVRWGQGAGLPHLLVTSALASTLRTVAMVASSGRAPVGALAGQLKMPTWKVEKAQRQARGWRPDGLSAALRAVAVADGAVKGGAADQVYALERALMAVVEARGVGR